MKWIIIDNRKSTSLHGVNQKTLVFSSKEIAIEVANQFFFNDEDFNIILINI
jgi:uncharacterized heparinase superfamily protein